MRVAIDARIPPGMWGGVQQVVEGLASGLSKLEGDEEYLFLVRENGAAWLTPFLGGGSRVVEVPSRLGRSRRRRAFDRISATSPWLANLAAQVAAKAGRVSMPLGSSDGYVESLGVDVVHFPTPQAFLTDLPTIYQPHDLLHIHLPATLSPPRRAYRERAYHVFSHRATLVAMMTEWGRRDICEYLDLSPRRVAVVPGAPVVALAAKPEPERSHVAQVAVPDRFLLYPAQTWPHKNHLGLLEAIATLRDRGTIVPVVCTGRLTENYGVIRGSVERLGLQSQVQFRGFVSTLELEQLYRDATALVFPSRFEGWGFPLVEAFAIGLPVVSSNATVLPEVAGGAALLFDPDNPADMAAAISRIWTDADLRRTLVAKGLERAAALSWERAARTFRALYRTVAGRGLTDEDRAMLAPPTMVQ